MSQDEREPAHWNLDQTLCWISTGDVEVARGGDWLRLFTEGEAGHWLAREGQADEPPPWQIMRGREAAINLLKNLLADGALTAFEEGPGGTASECSPMQFASMPIHFSGGDDGCYFAGRLMAKHRPFFKRKQVLSAVPPLPLLIDEPAPAPKFPMADRKAATEFLRGQHKQRLADKLPEMTRETASDLAKAQGYKFSDYAFLREIWPNSRAAAGLTAGKTAGRPPKSKG